ncbi:hypothetical protein LCGC14_1215670 [marine sediment metagenome]|uniref:Uncharacterized protein n=1 Tax=marine sediment metagenome TaxID=412755 RepID=A0A0F9PHC4_9ZZZZ
MKKAIFAILAIVTLMFVVSCTSETTTDQDSLYAIDKGTPPPPNG